MDFTLNFEWLQGLLSRKDIARALGNAVAPQMMTEVARAVLASGVFSFADDCKAEVWSHGGRLMRLSSCQRSKWTEESSPPGGDRPRQGQQPSS